MNFIETKRKKSHIKSLLNNSLFTFVTTAFIFLLRIVKNAIISRILGPKLRGAFVIVVLIPEIIVCFGNLGFGIGMVYYAIKGKYDFRKIMGASFLFFFIVTPILIGICFLVLKFEILYKDVHPLVTPFSVLIIISIPFVLWKSLASALIMAKSLIREYNIFRLLESIVPLLIFMLIWFWLNEGLTAAVWGWFTGIVVLAVLTFLLFKKIGGFPPEFSIGLTLKGLRFGALGHPANFLHFLLLRIDFFFISGMLGAKELGYYAVSSSLAEILVSVAESVCIPYMPLLLGMERKEAENFSPIVIRWVFVMMIFLALSMALVGKLMISILFGSAFAPSYPALILLLPGVVALGVHPILKMDFFRQNKPGLVSTLTSVALIINILLNYLTIPKWGIFGAAFSSSVSYLITVILLMAAYCRMTSAGLFDLIFPPKEDFKQIIRNIKQKLRGHK